MTISLVLNKIIISLQLAAFIAHIREAVTCPFRLRTFYVRRDAATSRPLQILRSFDKDYDPVCVCVFVPGKFRKNNDAAHFGLSAPSEMKIPPNSRRYKSSLISAEFSYPSPFPIPCVCVCVCSL